MRDRFTNAKMMYPSITKDAKTNATALRHFYGPTEAKVIYSDNAKELKKAAKELRGLHLLSTPYRHESTAVAERSIGVVERGCEKFLVSCAHATEVVALGYGALLLFAEHQQVRR